MKKTIVDEFITLIRADAVRPASEALNEVARKIVRFADEMSDIKHVLGGSEGQDLEQTISDAREQLASILVSDPATNALHDLDELLRELRALCEKEGFGQDEAAKFRLPRIMYAKRGVTADDIPRSWDMWREDVGREKCFIVWNDMTASTVKQTLTLLGFEVVLITDGAQIDPTTENNPHILDTVKNREWMVMSGSNTVSIMDRNSLRECLDAISLGGGPRSVTVGSAVMVTFNGGRAHVLADAARAYIRDPSTWPKR